jgi:hypothetical protein
MAMIATLRERLNLSAPATCVADGVTTADG